MKIRRVVTHEGMDYVDIRREFLDSDADALFLQSAAVTPPDGALLHLARHLIGGLHCVCGWVPAAPDGKCWNALRLVADHTVTVIPAPERGVVRVDYTGMECMLLSRELVEQVPFDGTTVRELRWVTGFVFASDVVINFCNDVHEHGYKILMDGDVVCEKTFAPDAPDVEDPPAYWGTDLVTVAFVGDEGYARPLAVAIRSLVDHFPLDRALEIIVGDVGLTDQSRHKLAEIHPITFVPLDTGTVDDIPINIVYHNAAIFGRLLLLPRIDRPKVLYLDADIVVRGDVTRLWDIDLAGHVLAAAQDMCIPERDGHTYFNSGVLLVDLARWRALDVSGRAIRYVQEKITNFTDQDAINDATAGDFQRVSRRWNTNSLDPEADGVKILHFLGGEKPWWYRSELPTVSAWFQVLDRTPFAGWRPGRPVDDVVVTVVG